MPVVVDEAIGVESGSVESIRWRSRRARRTSADHHNNSGRSASSMMISPHAVNFIGRLFLAFALPAGPNRMFPTKAVRIWRALDDRERAGLIATYFRHAGGFGEVTMEDRSIDSGGDHDPLYAVWAHADPA